MVDREWRTGRKTEDRRMGYQPSFRLLMIKYLVLEIEVCTIGREGEGNKLRLAWIDSRRFVVNVSISSIFAFYFILLFDFIRLWSKRLLFPT